MLTMVSKLNSVLLVRPGNPDNADEADRRQATRKIRRTTKKNTKGTHSSYPLYSVQWRALFSPCCGWCCQTFTLTKFDCNKFSFILFCHFTRRILRGKRESTKRDLLIYVNCEFTEKTAATTRTTPSTVYCCKSAQNPWVGVSWTTLYRPHYCHGYRC